MESVNHPRLQDHKGRKAISQNMYVDKTLAEAGMQRCSGNYIPMQPEWKPLRKEDREKSTTFMIINSE
jgi:signal-transduction protein with cAMP-binding, CBS, and nucleotidyltransferase domain